MFHLQLKLKFKMRPENLVENKDQKSCDTSFTERRKLHSNFTSMEAYLAAVAAYCLLPSHACEPDRTLTAWMRPAGTRCQALPGPWLDPPLRACLPDDYLYFSL